VGRSLVCLLYGTRVHVQYSLSASSLLPNLLPPGHLLFCRYYLPPDLSSFIPQAMRGPSLFYFSTIRGADKGGWKFMRRRTWSPSSFHNQATQPSSAIAGISFNREGKTASIIFSHTVVSWIPGARLIPTQGLHHLPGKLMSFEWNSILGQSVGSGQ